jgi:hypothetical protein
LLLPAHLLAAHGTDLVLELGVVLMLLKLDMVRILMVNFMGILQDKNQWEETVEADLVRQVG